MKRPNWSSDHPIACTCQSCTDRRLRKVQADYEPVLPPSSSESRPSKPLKSGPRRRRGRHKRRRKPLVFIGLAIAIVVYMVWSDMAGAQEAVGGLWSSTTDRVSKVVSSEPPPPPTRREVLRRADDLSTLWWALALSPSVVDCQDALRIVFEWRNEMEGKYGPIDPVDVWDALDANFLSKAAQQGLDRGVGTREMWERLDDFDHLIRRIDRAC